MHKYNDVMMSKYKRIYKFVENQNGLIKFVVYSNFLNFVDFWICLVC
jgi:hypothetical protein